MTETTTPQRGLPAEIESLLAALMASEPAAELCAGADRLEATISTEGELPVAALDDLRSAIDLIRGNRPCPAVSALLAARSALTLPS